MNSMISVSTSAELYEALNNAKGGETILLEGGEYGQLLMNGKAGFPNRFASTVKIMSADAENPAIFDRMRFDGAQDVEIEGVVFDYTYTSGDPDWLRPFQINRGTNISITDSVFSGTAVLDGKADEDGFGIGIGLSVTGGSDIVVDGNEFTEWSRAAIFSGITDLTVSGNEIHDIRGDGMDFVKVQNVLIEDNYIHDFKANYAAGDHRDMIQFWTNGATTPSTDITIRNNTLDMGNGSYTQSIFMRNEAVDFQGGGKDMYYQNVLIEGNTIYNGHSHGITVGETTGLIIRENSLIAVVDDENPDQSGSALWVPAINVNIRSENVVIQANATATIKGHNDQSDWVVKNNAFIQNSNPNGPGHYDDVFVTSSMDVTPDGYRFTAVSDSMLEVLQAGAPELRAAPKLENAEALFEVETSADEKNTHVFDAGLTAQILAEAGVNNATYMWSFGDGEIAQGESVTHTFTHAGAHDVTLQVRLANGKIYSADSPVDIRGGKVVSFDGAQAPGFVAHAYGEDRSLAALTAFEDGALQLGGSEPVAKVWRGTLEGLRGTDELALDFTLQGDGAGEVFRLHMAYVARVHSNGDVGIQMYNQNGQSVYVTTKGVAVNDGQDHDISVQLQDGALQVFVDGTLAGEKPFAGTLPPSGSWDMVFGNPWGQGSNFDGAISAMSISAGVDLKPLPEMSPAFSQEPAPMEPAIEVVNSPEENGAGEAASPAEQSAEPEAPWSIGGRSLLGEGDEASSVRLSGARGEYKNLGRVEELEKSDALAFSVDFAADADNANGSRLIWNHMKLGLTLKNDKILVNAATKDDGFKGFATEKLGLTAGETYNAVVLLNSATDRLQILVNNEIALDVENVDFDHVGAGGGEWGWSIGTAWDRAYKGEVSELHVSDQFEFRDEDAAQEMNDIVI